TQHEREIPRAGVAAAVRPAHAKGFHEIRLVVQDASGLQIGSVDRKVLSIAKSLDLIIAGHAALDAAATEFGQNCAHSGIFIHFGQTEPNGPRLLLRQQAERVAHADDVELVLS
ncbi:MAG: hypothetical protein ACK56I_37440, partial [bacterium]